MFDFQNISCNRIFTLLLKEKFIVPGLYILIFPLIMSACHTNNELSGEEAYLTYCGGCHLAPNPANIPKKVWQDDVLPNMAERLGYEFESPNQKFDFHVTEDIFSDDLKHKAAPQLDSVTWNKLYQYILSCSPDSILVDISRSDRLSQLKQFTPESITLKGNDGFSFVSMVKFDTRKQQFILGDAFSGDVIKWPEGLSLMDENYPFTFYSPVVSYYGSDKSGYVCEIGEFLPSDIANGILYKVIEGAIDTVINQLYRPTYLEVEDLDNDGVNEIIICEFGKREGQLSMLTRRGSETEKRSLLNLPGIVKVAISDMNKDGLMDIVVLSSQGIEGIHILYNSGNLSFRTEQVISMSPEYGMTWFELLDYDNDSNMDIVLVCGDNADLTVFPKPYHGVRLFLNNGLNQFRELWFYPVYGATRVLPDDYDLDGDIDFAVMAFFPDYSAAPLEGFVFLENVDPANYVFQPYGYEESLNGRWLVMDKGDIDNDGDIDIMLGSHTMRINRAHNEIMERWTESKVNVQLLRNNAIPN